MRPIMTFIAGSALLLASCQSKENLKSGIDVAGMDTLVKPGDNFNAFVNGTWYKKTEIPADKSRYGTFDQLQDRSQENVKAIIEEASKNNPSEGSDEQKIGDYYASFLDRKARDAKGVSPLTSDLAKIDAIQSTSDLAAYFGYANRIGLSIPFGLFVETDFKNPNVYTLMTWQSGLGLPEREYYLSTDPKMVEIRRQYLAFTEKMLGYLNDAKAKQHAARILEMETDMAKKHMPKELTRDITKLYNPYTLTSVGQLMGDFDYRKMVEAAGYSSAQNIVISQVEYTQYLPVLVKKYSLEDWKSYLKFGLINHYADYLTSDLDKANFSFYGTVLTGVKEQEPDWKRAVSLVNGGLGELVGKLYVARHFKPEAKERMTQMVKNLLAAYAESIKKLDWMGEKTKKEALAKIDKFLIKIGYPDKWRDYSSLSIKKDDLFGNYQRAVAFEYERNRNKLGKPVDRTEWGMTPQTVNAYYNPTFNEIVFPAAILQPPFFNMEADDAVNYGAIGAVIGHEIGHGFDDQGSAFDGTGQMRNWWTPEDLAAFQSRTQKLIQQYDSYYVFPDLHVNGSFTLGENIGDLGGLSIAVKAYKNSLKGKEAPVIDGYTGLQRVFLGWGQAWREKSREEALRNLVATNPHSPAQFRANGTIRNVPEWYEAFGVKPGDSLYLSPEQRVKIW